MDTVVEAWLVGAHADISPVVCRSIDWLTSAIEKGESFGESVSFHFMRLHWARAMAQWMSSGSEARLDWVASMNFEKQDWTWNGRSWSNRKIINDRLDDFMAFAVQSGEYMEGINTYEHFAGAKKLSLQKILSPRDYAYAICLAQARDQYDEVEVYHAGRRMLQANLDENWLGIGQSLRAATWLKIVHSDRDLRAGRAPQITPLQTILKAYDDMPNVVAPDT
ncbi:MAG: hypothetical protein V4757_14595 [Pseudomonadota bacterium]